MDVLTLAFGTGNPALLVFLKRENEFKRLLAIFAIVFVAGHGSLRRRIWRGSRDGVRPGEEGVKDGKAVAGGGVGEA